MLIFAEPSHVAQSWGPAGERLPGSRALMMPGGRAQVCRLPSPGISGQSGVEGEAGMY